MREKKGTIKPLCARHLYDGLPKKAWKRRTLKRVVVKTPPPLFFKTFNNTFKSSSSVKIAVRRKAE